MVEINIKSPITGGSQVSLERSISSKYIIQAYLESYGIDVRKLFRGKDSVEVYKCEESDFRFFGPEHLAGDSDFYESLQEFPWYYMDWKWEHQVISEALKKSDKVLEIGCAEGAFIERLDLETPATGLELNVHAAEMAVKKGLDVRTETIQDHAESNPNSYDMVCSFQVMEHVTDVKGIVEASVKSLRPGGKLVISVPNNDSFIKFSPDSILNMPPHHMCLWDEKSLGNLQSHFDLDNVEFLKEPLQKYHYPVVMNNFIEQKIGRGFIGKVIKRMVKITKAYRMVGMVKSRILGHSIIAVYTKKG